MHLSRMGLFSFAIIGLLGQSLNGQVEATANAWIRRSGSSVELLFRGRILGLDGVVDETATVQVIDHPDPLANHPRVRDIRVENGEFRFASDGPGFMTLYACSQDRVHQAVRTFAEHELASQAASGHFDIQLRPSKPLLNDKGEILATSEAPIGNIGMPDASVESLKHMRKMLTEAASDLMTPEEIESLLDTLQ